MIVIPLLFKITFCVQVSLIRILYSESKTNESYREHKLSKV